MSDTEQLLGQLVREIIKPENAMRRQELIHTFAETFDKQVEAKVLQIVDIKLAEA